EGQPRAARHQVGGPPGARDDLRQRRGLPDPRAGSAQRLRRLGNAERGDQAVPRREDLQTGAGRVRQEQDQGELALIAGPTGWRTILALLAALGLAAFLVS